MSLLIYWSDLNNYHHRSHNDCLSNRLGYSMTFSPAKVDKPINQQYDVKSRRWNCYQVLLTAASELLAALSLNGTGVPFSHEQQHLTCPPVVSVTPLQSPPYCHANHSLKPPQRTKVKKQSGRRASRLSTGAQRPFFSQHKYNLLPRPFSYPFSDSFSSLRGFHSAPLAPFSASSCSLALRPCTPLHAPSWHFTALPIGHHAERRRRQRTILPGCAR